jgi:aspartyl-tRNA(Asn)/glutamyl-tRNA(Gln) amidotransferase subunit A
VAAVAAGLIPLAIGTDGGGSIRRPAAHTGLVGPKVSIGRIPRAHGFPPILLDCEVVGPIGRTVNDVRVALAVMARAHREDPRSRAFQPLADASVPPRLRILFVERFGDAPVDPAIVESCRRAFGNLEELGHAVSRGALPFSTDAVSAAWGKIGDAGLAMLAAGGPQFFERASAPYVQQARAGAEISAAGFLELIDALQSFRSTVGRAFENIDLIVTPTTAAQPWPAEEVFPPVIDGREAGPRGHAIFTGWVNACGHPAVSIPIDPAPDGMPIGLQLVGDFGAESLLLDLAQQYESARPWAHRWPAMAMT